MITESQHISHHNSIIQVMYCYVNQSKAWLRREQGICMSGDK